MRTVRIAPIPTDRKFLAALAGFFVLIGAALAVVIATAPAFAG